MADNVKTQEQILSKLRIKELNEMQLAAQETILSGDDTVLLSPTGTGKTLAFLLPIVKMLEPSIDQTQVLVLVPSRELAIQIEQVTREMGSGYKVNAVYGGRSGAKDKVELKNAPVILIGTPGRVADHIRRENISTASIRTLVLDEFDKSLQTGFEVEMREIIRELIPGVHKILTSATKGIEIPNFARLKNPVELNFLSQKKKTLKFQSVSFNRKNKYEVLKSLLGHTGSGSGIVFCNFKDTIERLSDYLVDENIGHACFYGGMEQIDRERSLLKFRNGTQRILVSTDLAARGLDVPEMDFIIHFELPHRKEEFTHRNGRTARMHSSGVAYVLKREDEDLPPDFLEEYTELLLKDNYKIKHTEWLTLYISGGRKDKISKGDIAGLFMKKGNLKKDELGTIELKQDCAFVAVPESKAQGLIDLLNNSRLKKRKVRISELE